MEPINRRAKTTARIYSIDVRECYTDEDTFRDAARRFGSFSPDGRTYTVTDPDTPRPWMNLLANDRFVAVVANHGEGFDAYGRLNFRVTRYYDPELYLVRRLDGARVLELIDEESGEEYDLFGAPDLRCAVMPGASEFTGHCADIAFCVRLFVPLHDPCVCWSVELRNDSGRPRQLLLRAGQSWVFQNQSRWGQKKPAEKLTITEIDGGFLAEAEELGKPNDTLFGTFTMSGCTKRYHQLRAEPTLCSARRNPPAYKEFKYRNVYLYAALTLGAGETAARTVVSSASPTKEEALACASAYAVPGAAEAAYSAMTAQKLADEAHNRCTLPDKNLERFLNIWLKNQLAITYRYNRASDNGGFRDVLQDCWGAMLIHPDYAKERMLEALAHLYPDGHAMRVYDSLCGVSMSGDFVDCPLWAPCTVAHYIKETGDFSLLDEPLPYFDSDEVGTVEEHLWRTVDHAYHCRGENGLLLMRDGDWLDGLAGINQNGTATSAWATMEAYWAQNILAELYGAIGQTAKAAILRERSAEYKRIVREVAWDGQWYVYGFKSDGLPVGSHKCREGKIYLNPQSWAIFTGIEDDPARIKAMRRAVSTYLTTPFGPCLLWPPYVNDTTCGRLSTQVPGSFANAAIYLHGASFKVYADVAAGEYDEACDTLTRLLPNHPDNPDCRRTSEPWCTGNVHFGPDNPRWGMNLFSWFTATPAWLIRGGFEQILGVEADYTCLHVTPHVPSDWDTFSVIRLWQGRQYALSFRRAKDGERKGIYAGERYVGETAIPAGETDPAFCILY